MRNEVDFLCRWASQLSLHWYYHFWWVWPSMPKVLKVTSMQCLCNISRKNWVMKLMFCMLINMKFFCRLIVISLWHLKKEVKNEVRNLTALPASNTALTIYYVSRVFPPLTLSLTQYGIHTKPFLHLISCLCNISLLLLF